MNTNDYLDYRNALGTIKSPSALVECFAMGLSIFDVLKLSTGEFCFASDVVPLVADYISHTTKLIKGRIAVCLEVQLSPYFDFARDPSCTEEQIDEEIAKLLQMKVNSFLHDGPPPKPPIFGIDYQIEDVVTAVKKVLEN